MEIDGQSYSTHDGDSKRHFFRGIRWMRPARGFWIFLAFLGVSVLFWCIQTFNGHTTLAVSYDIRLINLPSERIVTSFLPDKIQVSLSGRGFMMLNELFSDSQTTIEIDYSNLPKNGDCAVIDLPTWRKILQKVLADGVTVSAVNHSPLEIYTAIGQYKSVPVISRLKSSVAKSHVLLSADFYPQYVNVYAPTDIFDTISAVYTEEKIFRGLNDTTRALVAIEPIRGVKIVPDSVRVEICVDLITTQSINVPIQIQNKPESYNVKTFPHEVAVSFNISSSLYGSIKPEDFVLAIDFQSLKPSNPKCEVTILNKPEGVSSVSLSPSHVEYIIEQCKK